MMMTIDVDLFHDTFPVNHHSGFCLCKVMGVKMVTVVVVMVAVVLVIGMVMQPAAAQDNYTDFCEVDEDCLTTPYTYCLQEEEGVVNGTCQCLPTHNNKSGTCLPNKIGDECTRYTDCSDIITNSFCASSLNQCRCKLGYMRFGEDKCKAYELDGPCRRNEDCQFVIEHSVCVPGENGRRICACGIGYHTAQTNDSQSICETNDFGSKCESSEECDVIGQNHVICYLGECNCAPGYSKAENENDTFWCAPNALNSPCRKELAQDCVNITYTVCSGNPSRCVCDEGFREDINSSECVRTLLNTACDDDHQCHALNSTCDFHTGFCNCHERFEVTPDELGCYFRYLGDVCSSDEDCRQFIPNSECVDLLCSCHSNYFPTDNNTDCQPYVINHTNCTKNYTCDTLVTHSYCDVDTEVCACKTGYKVMDDFNKCEEKKLVDECLSDEDCTVTNPSSECSGTLRTCQCVSGHVMVDADNLLDKKFCQRRELGRHECERETDCSHAVSNSTCVSCDQLKDDPFCMDRCEDCQINTCVCQVGFFNVENGTRCQGRKLLNKCAVHVDCYSLIPNAICRPPGLCYCQSGYQPIGDGICRKRKLEDVCHLYVDCDDAIKHSYCLKETVIDEKNNKIQTSRIGKCVCRSGYNPVNGTLCHKRRIGDKTCAVHTDCSDAISESICTNGMCVCRPGYVQNVILDTCTKRILNGHICSLDQDCNAAIENAKCSDHQCVCQTGYRSKNVTSCVKFKLGDAGCRTEADCAEAVANSTCSDGDDGENNCSCVIGYHPDTWTKATCVARNISGHPCSFDEDCSQSVANSVCLDEQCACMSGFYHVDDGSLCVKRRLGDECNVTSDCDDVINNSTCSEEVCMCDEGFDPDKNNSQCFQKPKRIGSPCISAAQCHAIDDLSTCNTSDDVIKKCACPHDMFVSKSQKECVKMPTKIGDRCVTSFHCTQRLDNSVCHHDNETCICDEGFFIDEGGRLCSSIPVQFGDRCLHTSHCLAQLSKLSVCDHANNTCVCQYGYTQNSSTECVERPKIRPYERESDLKPPEECQGKGQGSCGNQSNTVCVNTVGSTISHCLCDVRYARVHSLAKCVPVQTYRYQLELTHEAATYDYVSLPYKPQYKSSQLLAFKRFAQRVTEKGLRDLIKGTSLRRRFVSSEVMTLKPLGGDANNQSDFRVKAIILLHFKATPNYYHATSAKLIDKIILKQLSRSKRELGTSRLLVGSPLIQSSNLTDFNECGSSSHNDCAEQATCINTAGSFMCFCPSDHIDVSNLYGQIMGRACKAQSETEPVLSPETSWEFVVLVLVLFLLLIIVFIVYECFQRNQNFNARKLYERFGTTKIRRLKLNAASLRKLQERKKKKSKMNKKKRKKEQKKKKKGGGISSGTEESDIEKSSSTPVELDTEESAPSPSEILHCPTLLTESDLTGAGPMTSSTTSDYNTDSVTVYIDD